MPAILFGSISTVADTSELQRQAFNDAFRSHGLDWQWDQDDYREMLGRSGGRDRIAEYARNRGEHVDADAVHRTKSENFQRALGDAHLSPRPGVVDTVRAAHDAGLAVGLVTTTSPENVRALFDAVGDDLSADDFGVVVDSTDVDDPKPSPAAYEFALQRLGASPGESVAVEDNPGGVQAAVAAGVAVVAFPNENTAGLSFDGAESRVDALDPDELRGLSS